MEELDTGQGQPGRLQRFDGRRRKAGGEVSANEMKAMQLCKELIETPPRDMARQSAICRIASVERLCLPAW
jgi:hypothetical protein